MLRGRAVCPSGPGMTRLLETLKKGFEKEVGGKVARVSLLRVKGKMRDQDPTRFRNVLTNLEFKYDGVVTIGGASFPSERAHIYGEGDPTHEPTILQTITQRRQDDVAESKKHTSIEELRVTADKFADVHGPPLQLGE